MYQQINLYQPIFRKQRQIFSATTLAQVLGVVAAALLLLYGYGLLQVRGLEGQGEPAAHAVRVAPIVRAAGQRDDEVEALTEKSAIGQALRPAFAGLD